MIDLQSGIDMNTVSEQPRLTWKTLTILDSTWVFIREKADANEMGTY